MSINTVAIPNLDVNVWNQKIDLQQGNFPCSLTQPEITRQIPFEITYIEYELIKN